MYCSLVSNLAILPGLGLRTEKRNYSSLPGHTTTAILTSARCTLGNADEALAWAGQQLPKEVYSYGPPACGHALGVYQLLSSYGLNSTAAMWSTPGRVMARGVNPIQIGSGAP